MVAKRSEYQNQFKSSVVRKHHDIYRENLALRYARRDREFMHTPLCWSELKPEEELIGSDSSEEEIPHHSQRKAVSQENEVMYQSLAEIMAEAKEKADFLKRQRLSEQSRPSEIPSVERISLEDTKDTNKGQEEKDIGDKSLSIHDIVDQENRKLNKKIAQAYVLKKGKVFEIEADEVEGSKSEEEKPLDLKDEVSNIRKKTNKKKQSSKRSSATFLGKTKSCEKDVPRSKSNVAVPPPPMNSSGVPSLALGQRTSKRPQRPDRQGRVPRGKRRPASACPPQSQSKPPFVAYGAADVEDNLAVHRTHNVLALTDVYQPALRAKLRREEEQRRHKEKVKAAQLRASAGDLIEKLSTAGLTPRDHWASEYSLQFHGYEPREYERAVSARSVVPRSASASFQSFSNGGCKVVHVN